MKKILNVSKNLRYYLLALSLILVSLFRCQRLRALALLASSSVASSMALLVPLASPFGIVAFDMFVLKRGICSHVCPLGAFYAVISKFTIIRVKHDVNACTKCMKCKLICPEVQVLDMIGKESRAVSSSECISCGRCIDVCGDGALNFSIRNLRREK